MSSITKEQQADMMNWIYRGLIITLLMVFGFFLSSIYEKIENTHDSVIRVEEQIIRVEGRVISEKDERELWQMHLQNRIERLEMSGK